MHRLKAKREQVKFYLGILLSIPVFPILYYQGTKLKRSFHHLPEATDNQGVNGDEFEHVLKVIGLGESTLAAVGIDSQQDAFIGHFSRRLAQLLSQKVQWKIYAKSGYTAQMTLDEQVPAITEEGADLFVVALGGNDTFQRNNPKKWSKNMQDLMFTLRKKYPSTPILCTTMPPVHTFIAFNPLMRLILGQLIRLHSDALEKVVSSIDQVYYDNRKIDLKQWLKTYSSYQKKDFFVDGVHPSSVTFSIWGKEMAEFIHNAHFKKK